MSDFQNQPSETMEGAGCTEEYVNGLKGTIANMRSHIDRYRRTLHDAVNELCYQCGQYKKEYLGACNGCRWKGLRSGELD